MARLFSMKERKTVENLKQIRLFCLDMDGTIYLDNDLFDGTLDFLAYVKRIGGKALFLTNNSSKGIDKYIEKMARIGIEATAEDFITSTDATVLYIKEKYPEILFYAMGTESFVRQLLDAGLSVTTDISRFDEIGGVLISNDIELTFKKLDDVSRLLTRGAIYLATNPDPACPTAYGYVPDCGSFAQGFFNATGKMPHYIGKPEPTMIEMAMKKFGYKASETAMVGDMLKTDILAGNNAGVSSILVLSGGTDEEKLAASDIRPTYVFKNIRALLDALEN